MPEETTKRDQKVKANEPQPRDRGESKYSRERLISEALEFFGVGSHVMAGALEDADARKNHFTLDEAEQAVEASQSRPALTNTD